MESWNDDLKLIRQEGLSETEIDHCIETAIDDVFNGAFRIKTKIVNDIISAELNGEYEKVTRLFNLLYRLKSNTANTGSFIKETKDKGRNIFSLFKKK